MSVKRLELLDDLMGYVGTRVREVAQRWDHKEYQANKDILHHQDYAHQVTRELLRRAKKFRERDLKKREGK